MPASRFTAEVCDDLVARVAAGVSLSDAARAVSLDPRTVRGWLQRGRQEGQGVYFDFLEEIDDARHRADEAARRPLTEAEARQHLEDAIRAGSLRAIEVWLRRYGHEEPEPPEPDGLDALDAEAGAA